MRSHSQPAISTQGTRTFGIDIAYSSSISVSCFLLFAGGERLLRGDSPPPAVPFERSSTDFSRQATRMLDDFLGQAAACSLSACSIISLTTGSTRTIAFALCESFFPPGPYFSIRISHTLQHTRIRSSRVVQLALQLRDEFQIGWCRRNGRRTHNGLLNYQSRSKLFKAKQLMPQHVPGSSDTTACSVFPDRSHTRTGRELVGAGDPDLCLGFNAGAAASTVRMKR